MANHTVSNIVLHAWNILIVAMDCTYPFCTRYDIYSVHIHIGVKCKALQISKNRLFTLGVHFTGYFNVILHLPYLGIHFVYFRSDKDLIWLSSEINTNSLFVIGWTATIQWQYNDRITKYISGWHPCSHVAFANI